MKVKERRISEPRHIRQLITEQINILRLDESLDPIQRARAIAYLSTVSLQSMRDGEFEDRLKALELKYEHKK